MVDGYLSVSHNMFFVSYFRLKLQHIQLTVNGPYNNLQELSTILQQSTTVGVTVCTEQQDKITSMDHVNIIRDDNLEEQSSSSRHKTVVDGIPFQSVADMSVDSGQHSMITSAMEVYEPQAVEAEAVKVANDHISNVVLTEPEPNLDLNECPMVTESDTRRSQRSRSTQNLLWESLNALHPKRQKKQEVTNEYAEVLESRQEDTGVMIKVNLDDKDKVLSTGVNLNPKVKLKRLNLTECEQTKNSSADLSRDASKKTPEMTKRKCEAEMSGRLRKKSKTSAAFPNGMSDLDSSENLSKKEETLQDKEILSSSIITPLDVHKAESEYVLGDFSEKTILLTDGTYVCAVCHTMRSRTAFNLRRHLFRKHMINTTDKEPFSCTLCGYITVFQCDLQNHMVIKHKRKKPGKTQSRDNHGDSVVEKRKPSMNDSADENISNVTNKASVTEERNDLDCCLDSGSTPKRKSGRRKKSGKQIQPILPEQVVTQDSFVLKFKCPVCRKYVRNTSRANHQLECSGKSVLNSWRLSYKSYVCFLCQTQDPYPIQQELRNHIQSVHSAKQESHEGKKQFPCPACEKTYSYHCNTEEGKTALANQVEGALVLLLQHLISYHNFEVPSYVHTMSCTEPKCGFVGLTTRTMDLHKLSHDGKSACDVCGSFLSKASMYAHRKVCGNDSAIKKELFRCDRCQATFRRDKLLEEHKVTCMGHGHQYRCTLCRHVFLDRSSLQMHLLEIHNTQDVEKHSKVFWPRRAGCQPKYAKTLKCHLCSEKYAFRYRLNAHMYQKHGIRVGQKAAVLQCSLCGYSNLAKCNVKKHIVEVHLKKYREWQKKSKWLHEEQIATSDSHDPEQMELWSKTQSSVTGNQGDSALDLKSISNSDLKVVKDFELEDFLTKVGANDEAWNSVGSEWIQCMSCGQILDKLRCSLEQHIPDCLGSEVSEEKFLAEFHVNFNSYMCFLCEVTTEVDVPTFPDLSQLLEHSLNEHFPLDLSSSSRSFKCGYCDKMFVCAATSPPARQIERRISQVVQHCISTHSTPVPAYIKSRACSYPGCSYVAVIRNSLKAHMTRHCSKVQCSGCGKQLGASSLRQHLKVCGSAPSERQQTECKYCKKKYINEKTLQQHISSVHEKQRGYMCDECDAAFNRPNLLSLHQFRVHHKNEENKNVFKCAYCDLVDLSQAYVRAHIWSVHCKRGKIPEPAEAAADSTMSESQELEQESQLGTILIIPESSSGAQEVTLVDGEYPAGQPVEGNPEQVEQIIYLQEGVELAEILEQV